MSQTQNIENTTEPVTENYFYGYVYNSDQIPIQALIKNLRNNNVTKTDTSGFYRILGKKNDKIEISSNGYKTKIILLSENNNKIVLYDNNTPVIPIIFSLIFCLITIFNFIYLFKIDSLQMYINISRLFILFLLLSLMFSNSTLIYAWSSLYGKFDLIIFSMLVISFLIYFIMSLFFICRTRKTTRIPTGKNKKQTTFKGIIKKYEYNPIDTK